jgi:hypothetical protein
MYVKMDIHERSKNMLLIRREKSRKIVAILGIENYMFHFMV